MGGTNQRREAVREIRAPSHIAVVAVEFRMVHAISLGDENVTDVSVGIQLIRDLHQAGTHRELHRAQWALRELPGQPRSLRFLQGRPPIRTGLREDIAERFWMLERCKS